MPTLVTLSDLIATIRGRAEIRSGYVSDATLTGWINTSIAELWRYVCARNPDWYISDDVQMISIVAGTDTYRLRPDVMHVRGADILCSDGQWRNARPYQHAERNRLQMAGSDQSSARYRISGSSLRIAPAPSWSGTMRAWYIPTPPVLGSASTTGTSTAGSPTLTAVASTTAFSIGQVVYVAGQSVVHRLRGKTANTMSLDKAVDASGVGVAVTNGTIDSIAWLEDWVALSCCVKYMALEESDPSIYMAQMADLRQSIDSTVIERDIGEPSRIRDVRIETISEYGHSYDCP